MRGLALAAVLLLTADPRVDAGACRPVPLALKILTPDNADVGATLGVVVASVAGSNATAPTDAKTWRYQAGNFSKEPWVKPIAPGLDLYGSWIQTSLPGMRLMAGDVVVRTLKVAATRPLSLAAPAVHAITFQTGNRRSHVPSASVVELAADPPTAAVALVAFDPAGTAKSFGVSIANAKFITIFGGDDCVQAIAGSKPSLPGEIVQVAWVAADGTLSPKSPSFKVAAGPVAP